MLVCLKTLRWFRGLVFLNCISDINSYIIAGPEKEVQFVIVGEKAKAIMFRDSKNDIVLSVTELNKNPLNYAQVVLSC